MKLKDALLPCPVIVTETLAEVPLRFLFKYYIKNFEVDVSYKMHLTMIDGAVANVSAQIELATVAVYRNKTGTEHWITARLHVVVFDFQRLKCRQKLFLWIYN